MLSCFNAEKIVVLILLKVVDLHASSVRCTSVIASRSNGNSVTIVRNRHTNSKLIAYRLSNKFLAYLDPFLSVG